MVFCVSAVGRLYESIYKSTRARECTYIYIYMIAHSCKRNACVCVCFTRVFYCVSAARTRDFVVFVDNGHRARTYAENITSPIATFTTTHFCLSQPRSRPAATSADKSFVNDARACCTHAKLETFKPSLINCGRCRSAACDMQQNHIIVITTTQHHHMKR